MVVAMKSSSTISSSKTWYQPKWFRTVLFLLFVILSTTSVFSSTTPTISYSDHCASIVPESTPAGFEYTAYPLLQAATSYYTGGERFLSKNSAQSPLNSDKSLSFRTIRTVSKTKTSGVYEIKAYLSFQSSNFYYLPRNSPLGQPQYPRSNSNYTRLSSLTFVLNGFWSEFSEKLCMVGSTSGYSREGKVLNFDAVLKLNYARNSTISNSLVSGTLESLSAPHDQSYFEPVYILAFPKMTRYTYTMVSEEFDGGCSGGIDIPSNSSLSMRPNGICSMLSWRFNTFRLEYESKCKSPQSCTPFGGGIGYLPTFMSLYAIQCSENEQKLRYLVEFQNSSSVGYQYHQSFDPSTTLVGEGSWDVKKNRLCIVACRVLNATDAPGNSHLGDCSIRLSLRYPSAWSITKQVKIEGQIWTNKTKDDLGYFDKIKFQSSDNSRMSIPGLKYEYTQIDRAKKSCPIRKNVKKKGERYPNGHSYDMRFEMSVKNSTRKIARGYALPITIGNRFYQPYPVIISNSDWKYSKSEAKGSYTASLNISYKLSFSPLRGVKLGGVSSLLNSSPSPNGGVEISAEGVYNVETGYLCMIGCRNVILYDLKSRNDLVDCEILVNFQFSPVNNKNGGFIKGSIESTRKKTDPLYFEQLSMSSTGIYTIAAKRYVWRMDLEITMVLISNTLACVFIGLQLFHVKKHPDVLPSVSLFMLLVLTLGHMVPLVLNFEALFLKNRNRQNVLLGSGGWVEVNEVIVRVVTMVAFLLQFRLLQQVWTARLGDGNGNGKSLWVAEKKALFVSLPLYILGGLIALLVNWKKNSYGSGVVHSYTLVSVDQQHSLWGDLRSYAGLVLDGFLFPQILLNIFHISSDSVLSHSFYVGTTFVRLLPHAYDLYRGHSYARRHFDGSYFYANPRADFYSVAWDVIIPCGGMLFAVIIYLQQRFGGRCFLPRRFREGEEVYEKVPVMSSE